MTVERPGDGPVVVGYDGSGPSRRALSEAGPLLAPRRALVVVVWEPGVAFELMEPGLPLAPIDIRTALELDQAVYEHAQRVAEEGAALARKTGLNAEALAVADELSVADTLVRLAREREAPALVVGAHGYSRVRELLLGSTSRDVIRRATCPVVVVREPGEDDGGDDGNGAR
jgi:nucleotide-binding universal stress UspA family protein